MNKLYIVDGQKTVCQMLAESLTSRNYEVVGTSDKISGVVDDAVELGPEMIILEMNLPDGRGADLISKVRARLPDARFLVFSDVKLSESIKACLQAGAHGFVEKSVDFDMFLNAVKIVSEGGCFFGFNITEVLRTVVSDNKKKSQYNDNLTQREREVLQLIAQGNSNKDIAAKLELSVKTVDNHRCSMMRKLDVHNVAAITRYAIEHRLISVNFVD
ncbi:response regulator transcription factor [Pelagicoccus sp. NFK12]|uniref:Response regulator transcription factor n=1 Tax=Pelagicoccus enzymogenes TaxID=2773457 RepID=A0A927IFE2_9BACT|nr:response regulator transcription factor [Pelagicoccus enzymogenes]MBD5779997.1 response regulator transcription factor [Pelagicoccus enzymogenes]MDQ8198567.1 response regulator transcription factor [Pelagicoccus enzymogenes]